MERCSIGIGAEVGLVDGSEAPAVDERFGDTGEPDSEPPQDKI